MSFCLMQVKEGQFQTETRQNGTQQSRLTNRRVSLHVCHAIRNHGQDRRDCPYPLHCGRHRDRAHGHARPRRDLPDNVVYS